MFQFITQNKTYSRIITVFVLFAFVLALPGNSYAQLVLPSPGSMVDVSPAFVPSLIKGLTIHPDNPLKFDFLIDPGNMSPQRSRIQKISQIFPHGDDGSRRRFMGEPFPIRKR